VLTPFSKAAREFQNVHPTNGKKKTKNPPKISANKEKESNR